MPCYARPVGTVRAINSILAQSRNKWQALVVGDNCASLESFMKSHEAKKMQQQARAAGNELQITNNFIHCGHHGYGITNQNIKDAQGEFFIFMANDDIILSNHLDNYLSEIEDTNFDFVYFNSYIKPYETIRESRLQYGAIGHSEIIVRTSFLQQMPPHDKEYGHDWRLIENMLKHTDKYKKADSLDTTYHVLSLPNKREEGI